MNSTQNELSTGDFLLAASGFHSTVSDLQEAAGLLLMMASYIGDTGDKKEWRAVARVHAILDNAANDAEAFCDLSYRFGKHCHDRNDAQEGQK